MVGNGGSRQTIDQARCKGPPIAEGPILERHAILGDISAPISHHFWVVQHPSSQKLFPWGLHSRHHLCFAGTRQKGRRQSFSGNEDKFAGTLSVLPPPTQTHNPRLSKGHSQRSPRLDKPSAGINHMLHLQVQCCGHDGHDIALPQVQAGCIHEVQEDAKPLRVNFGVQVDDIQVALELVSEDAVEEATAERRQERRCVL